MNDVVYEPFKTVPLETLRDELVFEFPELPTQLLDHFILKTAIIMAKKAKIVRRTAIIRARHCVTRYLLESPDGMDICGIMSIRSIPYTCGCGSFEYEVPTRFVAPAGVRDCGREIAWYDDTERVLHVHPNYTENVYYVSLAVSPSRTACELPSVYLDEYLDTLIAGVKGHIMLISNRPWTNIQLGQAHYTDFMERVGQDSIDASTHKMRGAVKMNFGRAL